MKTYQVTQEEAVNILRYCSALYQSNIFIRRCYFVAGAIGGFLIGRFV